MKIKAILKRAKTLEYTDTVEQIKKEVLQKHGQQEEPITLKDLLFKEFKLN